MKEHGKVTERQFAGILANTLLGAGSLILPRTVATAAGTGAWLSVLIGGGFSLIVLVLIIKLGLRFPEETVIEYGENLTYKWAAKGIGLLLCIYWLILAGLVVRTFSSMLVSAVMIKTPIEMVIIAMLIVVVYFIRHDIEVVGRVNELYFIFIIIPIFFGILLSLREINFIRLMPVFGGQGLWPILFSGIDSFFSFLGFEIVFLLIPSITTQKLALNYGIKGLISPLVVYMTIVVLGIGIFGTEEIQNLTWPTLELIKVTPFPGLILERLEVIFISFWVIAIFTTCGNLYYAAVVGFSQVLKLEEHRTLVFPLLPLVYFVAVYPDSIYQLFNMMKVISWVGGFIICFITISYFLIAVLWNKRGDERS